MAKNKTPKFRDNDDRRKFKKKKSNKPKELYVRSNNWKQKWEETDEQEWEEEERD